MVDSPRKRLARSPSPWEEKSRSRSRSRSRSWSRQRTRSRSRSRGRDEDVNPGHTLYVTGLSTRVTERDLEDHFSKEGEVKSVFLIVEPRSRISRGFAFITMDSVEDANRCIKHLNQSVLEGRYITVEKSRRKHARTLTPGHYLGLKSTRGSRGNRYLGGSGRDDYGYRRSPRSSPYRGGRDYSPRPSSYYGGGCDYSPRPSSYRGGRDYSFKRSPHGGRSRRDRSRSYSPRCSPERNYARGSR
ncbi:serine arginine-rich splicing factor SR45a [Olea europaea subsp. europaea]|uniref:Serine arginine-rich splicing factor SR45a n=1 Tax=Olea europaea subsp. europaea TaxID=158383 RepID=A0A8S0TDL2_OLEEU|nr:serine arginine-rich splicing factor SR45a [Olea europaea subsp. europaea]